MDKLDILLDTNVIRRLMDDNPLMRMVLNNLKNDGYTFSISDMSLFELLTSNEVEKNLNKFLSILYDCRIRPIYKEILSNFNEQYRNWFKEPKSINEMKENLFQSFSFTLSTFLSDFSNAIILFLANKLTQDYSSEFYSHIITCVESKDTISHFQNVLRDCYFQNKEKLRKRIPKEFKDLILREFTFFNLLQNKSYYTYQEFDNEYQKQQDLYITNSFKEICSKYLTKDDIIVKNDEKIDNMDEKFIVSYIKDTLCNNRNFNINDITDYINFKYAFKHCYSYYTADKKSLKKYCSYFSEKEITDYMKEITMILDKYPFKP